MANPTSRGQQRDKPFRDALRMEIAAAQDDSDSRSLRRIARQLLGVAASGDVQAIKEVADRLDGKVPQGIGGAAELGPIHQTLCWDDGRDEATVSPSPTIPPVSQSD